MQLDYGKVIAKSTPVTVCHSQPRDYWHFEWGSSLLAGLTLQDGQCPLTHRMHVVLSSHRGEKHPTDFQMYPTILSKNHWATYVINTIYVYMQ